MSNHACMLVTALAVGAVALPAQRPLRLAVAGGVSLPTGALRDGAQAGWHALGSLAVTTHKQPLGLRIDGAYHRFALDGAAATPQDGAQTVASATANVTYRLPMTNSPLSPYVVTGLGGYHLACAGDTACDATTRFGWNAGLGVKCYVRGITCFAEARYHRTSRAGRGVPYVPITFGILL